MYSTTDPVRIICRAEFIQSQTWPELAAVPDLFHHKLGQNYLPSRIYSTANLAQSYL